MYRAISMCCSSHLTKVHVICIILKHHHSRFYISTARMVKSDLSLLFLLSSNIKLQEIMKWGEPNEFDNCLKNLKLKVNFVKEIIFDIFYRPSRYIFQVQQLNDDTYALSPWTRWLNSNLKNFRYEFQLGCMVFSA